MTGGDLRARLTAALSKDTGPSSDFDLNASIRPSRQMDLRGAGVLVPVCEDGRVILTKRSSSLSQHPGQVAFPGGRIEDSDADAVAAALREAWEEIALPPDAVEILGQLPVHDTVTNYRMTPVLALVRGTPKLVAEPGEVAEIFHVPLDFLVDLSNYTTQSRDWRGTTRHYHTIPWGPYYIWGATARILIRLAQRLS